MVPVSTPPVSGPAPSLSTLFSAIKAIKCKRVLWALLWVPHNPRVHANDGQSTKSEHCHKYQLGYLRRREWCLPAARFINVILYTDSRAQISCNLAALRLSLPTVRVRFRQNGRGKPKTSAATSKSASWTRCLSVTANGGRNSFLSNTAILLQQSHRLHKNSKALPELFWILHFCLLVAVWEGCADVRFTLKYTKLSNREPPVFSFLSFYQRTFHVGW